MLDSVTPDGALQTRPGSMVSSESIGGVAASWKPRTPTKAFSCSIFVGVLVSGAAAGGSKAMTETSPLTFACSSFVGGHAIMEADGRAVEHGHGVTQSLDTPAFIRIDRTTRRMTTAGTRLPGPKNATGPILVDVDPVRFTWGGASYEMEIKDGAGASLHSKSQIVIDSGPHTGRIMDLYLLMSCAVVPASDFPSYSP